MKKHIPTASAILSFSLLFTGCAHSYTLDSMEERPEYLNGVALSTAKSPKCIVQAGYQYSNPSEMLVKIRVTNHDKNAFDVDATAFTLNGSSETLKISPLPAVDPDRYLKDLNSEAELADSRTRMESYQGVEELAALKGDASDSNIDAAKSDYRRKMSEAEDARKAAAEIRKRIAILQPAA